MFSEDHITKIVKILTWPITSIILALLFRYEIRRVFKRLSSLTFRGFKADFKQQLEKLENEVADISYPAGIARIACAA